MKKNPENREDCLKRGLEQLPDSIGDLAKRKEWCFCWGWYRSACYGYKISGLNINPTNDYKSNTASKVCHKFLNLGSVFEILSESTPVNSRLTI